MVSYLPDRMYFANWMRAVDLFDLFRDFYQNFDYDKALAMCRSLGVEPKDKLKSMSKGTKEKVQLVLVMARKARLYLLDEPIAGVDPGCPVTLSCTPFLTNYNEDGTVLISTHLIADIEKVLDGGDLSEKWQDYAPQHSGRHPGAAGQERGRPVP